MLDRCSRSYRREDVFGPDTWVENVRTFDLPNKARKHYDIIVKDWILKAEDEGLDLTLTHALSRMLRLQQLTSGYLPGDAGPQLVHTEKIDLVMGDLNDIIEAGEKAVLFHQFTWEGLEYEERARKAGYTVFAINGSVPIEERERSIREFRNAKTAVFVIQTQAGGIGIDLATSQHALFVSQSYSFAAETQARDRIYSPGQVRTVTYYRASRSIDQYIAHIIETKQSVHDAVRSSRIQDIANYEIVRTKGRLF
jgi:SNF2 family DNA or RNA helicase